MTLHAIKHWQQTARPSNQDDASLALGIFLEEVAEVLAEFHQETDATRWFNLAYTTADLATFAGFLKDGSVVVSLPRDNRANCVKELADVIVTAVGVGHALNLDVPTACNGLPSTNLDKLEVLTRSHAVGTSRLLKARITSRLT